MLMLRERHRRHAILQLKSDNDFKLHFRTTGVQDPDQNLLKDSLCRFTSVHHPGVLLIGYLGLSLRPRSHYSVFVSIRFCCIEATVHTAPFSYEDGEKNLRFCAFTLICPITKTQRKTSLFVRSHCSVFVKLIVAYWSVFKNLRFCAFTLIQSMFKTSVFVDIHFLQRFRKPPFLWRFCAD